MSDTNHVMNPEHAMLEFEDKPDTAQARQTMAQATRQRITLDPSKLTFTSRGSITIEWTDDDGETWQSLKLPLKSLGARKNQQILDAHRPPDDAYVPRVQNERGEWIMDVDSLEYSRYAIEFLSEMIGAQYEKLLYAYDGDLMSVDGSRLVWSSIDPKSCDEDEALRTLDAMNIPQNKLGDITSKIDSLSLRSVVEDNQQAEGEPPQPLESLDNSGKNGPRARRAGQRRDSIR